MSRGPSGVVATATRLAIRHSGTRPCSAVRDLLDARIAEIDIAVADLPAPRQSLAETRQE